jgi:resuscitation-promoting factor RpfB
VVYIDGAATGQTVLSTTVLTPPTNQVVKVGTKPAAAVPATPSAPIVVDPGSAQAIAQQMLLARGWGDDQFSCLVQIWNRESGWRVNAANSSGAYGIPQALPGSKMAAYGADWQTNPATQIAWGLAYIAGRYGTPCGAWSSWQVHGWY